MKKQRHKIIPASYLFLLKNNTILLLRRFNTGYEDGNYSVVAGHVDKGETFTDCVIRETKEEIGIKIIPKDLKIIHMMHRDSRTTENNERIDCFFITTRWKGEIKNMEPNKCDNLSWFDINNLPNNIIPYIKKAVDCMVNNIHYSEYGWEE